MKLKVIVSAPKSVIDAKKLTRAAEAQLDASAKEASDLLTKPTANWNHKPKMRTVKGRLWRAAGTNDKIYRFVNDGTRAHAIRAKGGKMLAFGPSRPKTRPGSLTPRAGSRKQASTFVKQVNHPGTKPREFDKAAAKKLQRTLKKQMQDAITKALQ
jgi:hypothetical protein